MNGFYTPTTATGPRVFTLTDSAPTAPGARTATTNSTLGGVDVGWTILATAENVQGVTGYSVLRAAAMPPTITGGATTCPTLSTTGTPAAGWTAIKSLPAQPTAAQRSTTFLYNPTTGAYTFKDTTASAGPGTTALQYCYAISSVADNAAGTTETGPALATTPDFASAGTAIAVSGAPAFQSSTVQPNSAVSTSGVVAFLYNQLINTGSVDVGDFTVTATTAGGVSTPETFDLTSADNTGLTNTVGKVVLTVTSGFGASDTIVVHAKVGTDLNTVLNNGTPALAQATTDAVQIAAS